MNYCNRTCFLTSMFCHARIQRGGGGGGSKITKIVFPSNTGPVLPKKSQSYQASIHCWAIIGGLSVVFESPHQLKKYDYKAGPPLKKLSGSAHACNVVLSVLSRFTDILLRKRERASCFTLTVSFMNIHANLHPL